MGGHKIEQKAIDEVPSQVDLKLEEEERYYVLYDAIVDIHASDRDYKKRGWYAVIEDVLKEHLKMELYPIIDPETIYGKTKIIADVIVVTKKDEHGEYKPKMYHLINVKEIL